MLRNTIYFDRIYSTRMSRINQPYMNSKADFIRRKYSGKPEIQTADLYQSHVSLNFGYFVYFIETCVSNQK